MVSVAPARMAGAGCADWITVWAIKPPVRRSGNATATRTITAASPFTILLLRAPARHSGADTGDARPVIPPSRDLRPAILRLRLCASARFRALGAVRLRQRQLVRAVACN